MTVEELFISHTSLGFLPCTSMTLKISSHSGDDLQYAATISSPPLDHSPHASRNFSKPTEGKWFITIG